MAISRRSFILILSALGFGSYVGYFSIKTSSIYDELDLTSTALVGKKYLSLNPKESDLGLLVGILFSDIAQNDESAMINALKKSIENDFRSGKMVNIAGWYLSITECRFCSLVYLNSIDSHKQMI